MIELAFTSLYFALVAVALQFVVLRICCGNAAMWQRRNWFRLAAIVWCVMPIAKVGYVDDIIAPTDALLHESIARGIAEQLREGSFENLAESLALGNGAYRTLLGVFYGLSGADEVVTYLVNGSLGFIGLLMLLDVLCRHTLCQRLPASVMIAVSLLPSGLLWTTANLKEGPILWGICAMLYLTLPARSLLPRRWRTLPFFGLIIVAVLRPHIAAAWLVAIAAGAAFDAKRFGLFFSAATAAGVSLLLLGYVAPDLFEAAMGNGVSTTLSDRYDSLSTNDSLNGTALAGNNPIPVLSGIVLIMFRPWPREVSEISALLVGVEVWVLAVLGFASWWNAKRRWALLSQPVMVTQIVALVALGYYFTYMYNLGLVVRQRLMCFPAVLFIYFYPLLAQQRGRIAAAYQRRSLARPTTRVAGVALQSTR